MNDSQLRPKALAVFRAGRLLVSTATADPAAGTLRPVRVVAAVRSSRPGGATYGVDYADGTWTCTCRELTGCAHIAAAQLATGYASPQLRGVA